MQRNALFIGLSFFPPHGSFPFSDGLDQFRLAQLMQESWQPSPIALERSPFSSSLGHKTDVPDCPPSLSIFRLCFLPLSFPLTAFSFSFYTMGKGLFDLRQLSPAVLGRSPVPEILWRPIVEFFPSVFVKINSLGADESFFFSYFNHGAPAPSVSRIIRPCRPFFFRARPALLCLKDGLTAVLKFKLPFPP